jgi:hypothetical protein
MTQREAKELTLELWGYLAKNPKVAMKGDVPKGLRDKIIGLRDRCPLCEVFRDRDCKGCVLAGRAGFCEDWDSPWNRWRRSFLGDVAGRREAAEQLVAMVSAWAPEEEQ